MNVLRGDDTSRSADRCADHVLLAAVRHDGLHPRQRRIQTVPVPVGQFRTDPAVQHPSPANRFYHATWLFMHLKEANRQFVIERVRGSVVGTFPHVH